MRALVALLGKDAREHALPALALGIATLAVALVAVARNRAQTYSLSPFEVVLFALLTFMPLVALIVGNRLVVREYLSGTRQFVEALPLGRRLPLLLKYLLGLGYLSLLTLALVLIAARAAGLADDVTADYVLLIAGKALVVVSLYWSVVFCFSLCGHLRVFLYLLAIGLVLLIGLWPGIDESRFAPFALLDAQLFVFERDVVPWRDIGGTLALSGVFTVAGFALSRIGEGALAERLAKPMTRRDHVALGVLGVGGLVLAGVLFEAQEREDFSFTSEFTLRSSAPAVSVLYGAAEHRAAGEAMLRRTVERVASLQAALGLHAVPVVRVALAPELERHDIDYATLDGVFVRASWLEHDGYDDAVLDAVVLHGVLGLLSGERVMFEPYHWVLDGVARWWAEQTSGEAHVPELLARAVHVARRGGELDLVEDWQLIADRFAYPGAEALAWSAMRYLEREGGREAVLALARQYVGEPLGGGTIAALADRRRRPAARFEAATGIDWRAFVSGWRDWLEGQAAEPAVREWLGYVPPLVGTLSAGRHESGVYRLEGGYRTLAPAGSAAEPLEPLEPPGAALTRIGSAHPDMRCVMKHDRLGPFDDEFDVDQGRDARTRDVAECRAGARVHRVGSRYAPGTRVYVAFDLEDGPFHQPLRLNAHRVSLPDAPIRPLGGAVAGEVGSP